MNAAVSFDRKSTLARRGRILNRFFGPRNAGGHAEPTKHNLKVVLLPNASLEARTSARRENIEFEVASDFHRRKGGVSDCGEFRRTALEKVHLPAMAGRHH